MFHLFSWNLKVKNGFLTASSCWFVVKIHSCVCPEFGGFLGVRWIKAQGIGAGTKADDGWKILARNSVSS